MDYDTLTGEVIANLEINSSDLSRFKVLESLNSAQITLLNMLPVEHLRNAVKTSTFDLVQNVVAYQWPPDFLRVLNIWLDFSSSISIDNRGREAMLYENERFFKGISEVSTQNYPFFDTNIENGFEIRPKPSANVTSGGRLRYIYKMLDISTEQKSLLSPALKNLLVFRATALSARVENYNHQLGNEYESYYEKELQNFLPKEERK